VCAGAHRVAELLHQLAHNHGQLAGDFVLELRVAFLRGNLLREVDNHPATDTPPLRSVKRIGLLFTARITAGICVNRHSGISGQRRPHRRR
jgi:hypothetical protein